MSLAASKSTAKRISAAVRRVERQPRNQTRYRRAPVSSAAQAIYLGKTDEAINKTATGTVSRYAGNEGTEEDTGTNDECKNRFANVSSGKWVLYTKINGVNYLVAAEC